ncbi:MAG: hypothetical protein EBR40_03025 [Proteobacteria bacterium]|jgi:hypothetical protein|nr:hypothetical protein [Pseudomonadota bacterium]
MNSPLPQLLASLCILCPVLSLAAQDQVAASNNAGPLQIQEQPVPGTMPAPSLFGPDKASPSSSSVGDDAAADSNSTIATPVAVDSNAPASNSGMGSPGQNPPPSDPNALIPPPVEPQQPSPVNASGNESKQREDQKTRYYTAKTQADKEEALALFQAKADKAKSDEAKRQALRSYYDLLAKRMKKIDPSISEWIDTMHAAYLRRLEQVRVEPTIPLNPPPAAEGSESPSPTPKKKRVRTQQAE